jgi:two-component system response regulator BaeR
MNNIHVLIVEDEEKIAQLLADYLKNEGYQTTQLHSGEVAVETIKDLDPSFVILDLMLPEKDGMTICREVRQFSNVPIMMLTARVDEIDRLMGLELGADDYVCKPFLPREVVARVKTILRRVQITQAPQETEGKNDSSVHYRSIELQSEKYICLVSGERIELTPVEFRLLQTMVAQPGRVFSRDSLMEASYPDGRIVSDRTVDSHVKNLRKKVNAIAGSEDLIHSIYGVGYKIE